MLTLTALRSLRIAAKLSRDTLAVLSRIDPKRLQELELRDAEPWFDEAIAIRSVLNLPTVGSLMFSSFIPADPSEMRNVAGRLLPGDLPQWFSGARVPLSQAFRVSAHFGLADPADLVVSPLLRQLWASIGTNERGALHGECPWCLAYVARDPMAHRDDCLAQLLLAPVVPNDLLKSPLKPARKGKTRGPGMIAHGLKALRDARPSITQATMAEVIGLHPNTLSQIERCKLPLRLDHAERIAAWLNIHVTEIYASPLPKRVANAEATALVPEVVS